MPTVRKKKCIGFRSHSSAARYKRVKGLGLLEALVSITIILVLMAILIPALLRAKRDTHAVLTMNNIRQIVTIVNCFASDHNNRYPESVATIGQLSWYWNWQEPTMLISCRKRSPVLPRSMSAYLRTYIEDARIMFCPNAPSKYKYLQDAWGTGDNWDNPDTPSPRDPLVGAYCFYWNYIGFLPDQRVPFKGPQTPTDGGGQSKLLLSDYFGYNHWRSPGAYSSCEQFKKSAVMPGTCVSSDYWCDFGAHGGAGPDKIRVKLHAGYTDGHVERYWPSQTIPMKVSITSDGSVPYPNRLGPGVFYLPKNALE